MRPMLVIVAAVALAGCSPPKTKPHADAPTSTWISLFDGKDLDGWTVKLAGENLGDNYRDTFRVENGVLEVRYDKYEKFGDRFGALYYNAKQSHYWLRVEYRFVGSLAPGAP